MSGSNGDSSQQSGLFSSPGEYFSEVVEEAFKERKIDTYPMVSRYIVDLLEHYLFAHNLFDSEDESGRKQRKTLAELLLIAGQSNTNERVKLLKKLGDSSLYISGFFGPSLNRKVVDVGYYVEMGTTAYGSLSQTIQEDTFAKVYREISRQFVKMVDVLTYIREKSITTFEQDLLRLNEIYEQTGSEFAREQLTKAGVITAPVKSTGNKKQ